MRLSIELDRAQRDELRMWARNEGRSLAAHLRYLVQRALEQRHQDQGRPARALGSTRQKQEEHE